MKLAMKLAIVTDDHRTISAHFGRAAYYEIFTIEDGSVKGQHSVQKTNHQHVNPDEPHQEGHSHNHDHASMLEPILDCDVLITRGMGRGAYNALKSRGIEPVITDIPEIAKAVEVYLTEGIVNHLESLH